MKSLNITLILAADYGDHLIKNSPFMPLSLAILASVAPEHNYTFIDMLWEPEKIDFNTNDEIIGISIRRSAEKVAFELADKFLAAGKTVILGGAQPSVVPHSAKKHATTVVVGEAEELWPLLLVDYQKGGLKDFYVCSLTKFDAKGHSCFQQNTLPNLKGLPLPKRHLYNRKYTFDVTFASRGCPINCDFCQVSEVFGKKIRLKPINDVVKDIEQFKRFYYLLDDTVFGRPNCYDYYLDLYDKIAQLPKKNYWTGQANLDAAGDEKGRLVIKKAAEAGLVFAAVGLESINQKTLEESGAYAKMGIKNKNEYIERMKDHISYIQRQGILISAWFTIGYGTDTIQTYYDSLEFCQQMNILPVFSPIRALPNTRLWHRLQKENKLQDISGHITNVKQQHLDEKEVVYTLQDTANKGYNFKSNLSRTGFYLRSFLKSEKSIHDSLYKTIFAMVTQIKMGQVVKNESKSLRKRLNI